MIREFDFEKLIEECIENDEEIVVNNTYKQNIEFF